MRITPIALVAALTAGAAATPQPKSASRSIDTFAARLHGEVGKKRGNLIYSPASVAMALAMTREGATGVTASELDAVLGATTGADARALGRSLQSTGKAPGPEVAIANRLFGDKQTPFVKRFVDITRDDYGAPIEAVDFRTQSEAARLRINAWVEQQTRTRIKDLLPAGTVGELTRLVLVNAIYMKAQWATPFEARMTKPAAFAIEGAASKQVPTMHGTVEATWGTAAGARMIDLPYTAAPGGPQLAMLIVVPDTAKLAAVEATYAKQGLTGFTAALTSHGDAAVTLPKFKFGSDFNLGDALQALGIKRAFIEDKAEFAAITTAARLHISKVVHKAWIEVDEKGTEAAAATAVITADGSVPGPPHNFKVDRSFAFFIHDLGGTVLFAGRVLDPTAP
jgi:serpin B